MGMYTEVYFNAEVRKDVAEWVESLEWEGLGFDGHPFFSCDRWWSVFRGASAYFNGPAWIRVVPCEEDEYGKYGPEAEKWAMLSLRASLKNYDNEVEYFFDWIRPFLREGTGGGSRGMIGYSLYEESDEPTIYYELNERAPA